MRTIYKSTKNHLKKMTRQCLISIRMKKNLSTALLCHKKLQQEENSFCYNRKKPAQVKNTTTGREQLMSQHNTTGKTTYVTTNHSRKKTNHITTNYKKNSLRHYNRERTAYVTLN